MAKPLSETAATIGSAVGGVVAGGATAYATHNYILDNSSYEQNTKYVFDALA